MKFVIDENKSITCDVVMMFKDESNGINYVV